jgi:hypothetical protein
VQAAKLITKISEIAGMCWTLAGECVRTHSDTSPEMTLRRTAQWRNIVAVVVELDRELTAETPPSVIAQLAKQEGN